MQNEEIAHQLGIYAKLLALHGGNSFQVNAYQAASFNINKKITQPLNELSEEELKAIPQLGKSAVGKILEMQETGSFESLTNLLNQTPSGVVKMLGIRGLGPKKVKIIWEEMGIETVGDLLDACRQNRLAKTKGFGEKTQAQVMEAIEFQLFNQNKIHWSKANAYVLEINAILDQYLSSNQYAWAGDYYRKNAVVSQLELVVIASAKRSLSIQLGGHGLHLVKREYGFELDIESKCTILVHFERNVAWKQYELSTPIEIKEILQLKEQLSSSEKELFNKNEVPYILPELREHENMQWFQTVDQEGLIKYDELKGSVHNHTTYSDGLNTLEEMAQACIDQGWQYFGVCDHSKTATYANGLTVEDLERQWKEIHDLNQKYGDTFKIYKGIESDILNDGSLDYEDAVLKEFDFVVASIHSNLRMDEEKAMQRLIKAIENPYTRILGHLTGRLLLMREGYPVDHHKIIDACAANGVCIELNSHPYRLDMDWRYIHEAMEKRVMISINPDAHITTGLLDMKYGVHVARKGGLTAEYCLNTKTVKEFGEWLNLK